MGEKRGFTAIRNEDCYDESIDTDDTCHDDRDDVFDNQIGTENSH
jgi:hypothetical protein